MTGADLHWPGIDRDRALAACWHLTRAVVRGQLAARIPVSGLPWQQSRRVALASAAEHCRIARGYLGAIGFEHGASHGLW